MLCLFLLAVLGLLAGVAAAAVPPPALGLPVEIRTQYRNPDGSCVQCSIGMCGADQNNPAAALLLWPSEYGPAVRGGSDPSRVARYCDARKINAYSITGSATFDWMKWACRTGRGCAIGAGRRHFQTLVGYDAAAGRWYVCNNNSPTRIDEYNDSQFRSLHFASGPWVVVLADPPHPVPPRIVHWWKD